MGHRLFNVSAKNITRIRDRPDVPVPSIIRRVARGYPGFEAVPFCRLPIVIGRQRYPDRESRDLRAGR